MKVKDLIDELQRLNPESRAQVKVAVTIIDEGGIPRATTRIVQIERVNFNATIETIE